MRQIVLKIDVDTYRGTLEGVPQLVDMLRRHEAGATFLFSLGPDHTGRAIRRVFRRGFLGKVQRTSVLEHYGLRTLMYGVLLPGPDIGVAARAQIRAVRDAGFEVGIHCWDHVRWQDHVVNADVAWTEAELEKARSRFVEIFGVEPQVHGAAGWQMNDAALQWQPAHGIRYASDCRGREPFVPVIKGAESACTQLPTTLPTLDELLGRDGITQDTIADHVLAMTETAPPSGHVFTLHAELEGMKLAPVLERLLKGWRAQGYDLVDLSALHARLDTATLPRCPVLLGEVDGRSGQLMVQGEAIRP
ncbi:MAG: 4-deoxy-4-formamido-L-arabinose-phosphoundecaprenol deformylase [Rhodocyclaceae bacterium]|nr:4-deoxy-4-formamido-L-arabinose-phosphoundecaprenol deformylase [Rhodocyclaceae bacterium]